MKKLLSVLWRQKKSSFPCLCATLLEVYTAPAATTGLERIHKIGKDVLVKTGCVLSAFCQKKEAATTCSSVQLRRWLQSTRGAGSEKHPGALCSPVVDILWSDIQFPDQSMERNKKWEYDADLLGKKVWRSTIQEKIVSLIGLQTRRANSKKVWLDYWIESKKLNNSQMYLHCKK